jgi:hypothetical protein
VRKAIIRPENEDHRVDGRVVNCVNICFLCLRFSPEASDSSVDDDSLLSMLIVGVPASALRLKLFPAR